MTDKKEELKKLNEEYHKLKEENELGTEAKILKKKIWALKHRGIIKTSSIIEGVGKGILGIFKKGVKKVGEAGRNYDNSTKLKVKRIDDLADIIP